VIEELEEHRRECAADQPRRDSMSDIWIGVRLRIGALSLPRPLKENDDLPEVPAEVSSV
jgi:hypothetical protein